MLRKKRTLYSLSKKESTNAKTIELNTDKNEDEEGVSERHIDI